MLTTELSKSEKIDFAGRSADEEVLLELAHDPDFDVREALMTNTNRTPVVIALQSKDEDVRIRAHIAFCHQTPPEIVADYVLYDKSWQVKNYGLENINETLERLSPYSDADLEAIGLLETRQIFASVLQEV